MLVQEPRTQYDFGIDEMSEEMYKLFWMPYIEPLEQYNTTPVYKMVSVLERLSLI